MLKKLLVVAVMLGVLSKGVVFASATQSVTTNILGLAVGSVNGIYEFKKGDKDTIGVGGSIWSISSGDWKLSSTSLGVDYNIYKKGKILEGFYIGPSLWLNMVSAEYTSTTLVGWTIVKQTEKSSGTFITLGGNLGYKWLLDNLAIGVGLGVGYTAGSIEVGGSKAPYGGFGLTRLALDIGYAW